MFFADVAGSSPTSAVRDTTHTVALANTFADVGTGAVSEHGAEVMKLMGDGVMAQFDPPWHRTC